MFGVFFDRVLLTPSTSPFTMSAALHRPGRVCIAVLVRRPRAGAMRWFHGRPLEVRAAPGPPPRGGGVSDPHPLRPHAARAPRQLHRGCVTRLDTGRNFFHCLGVSTAHKFLSSSVLLKASFARQDAAETDPSVYRSLASWRGSRSRHKDRQPQRGSSPSPLLGRPTTGLAAARQLRTCSGTGTRRYLSIRSWIGLLPSWKPPGGRVAGGAQEGVCGEGGEGLRRAEENAGDKLTNIGLSASMQVACFC